MGGHHSRTPKRRIPLLRGHGHDTRDSFGRCWERRCRVSVRFRFCADRPKQPGKEESSPSVSIAVGDAKPTAATAITAIPPSPTSSVLEAAINSLLRTELYCSRTRSEYFQFFRSLFYDAVIMVLYYTCLQNRGKFRCDRGNGWYMNRSSVTSRFQFYNVHKCERSKSSLKCVLPTTHRSLLKTLGSSSHYWMVGGKH